MTIDSYGFGGLLEPSAIAISSGYIIATDSMSKALEEGVEQKPVAGIACHRWSFNNRHEPFRPLVARPPLRKRRNVIAAPILVLLGTKPSPRLMKNPPYRRQALLVEVH